MRKISSQVKNNVFKKNDLFEGFFQNNFFLVLIKLFIHNFVAHCILLYFDLRADFLSVKQNKNSNFC